MRKCDVNKVSSVNLLHIFRTPFTKNTSEQLLLQIYNLPLDDDWKQETDH